MRVPEEATVAVELEHLRGVTEAGFARLSGRLDVVLERTDHVDGPAEWCRRGHYAGTGGTSPSPTRTSGTWGQPRACGEHATRRSAMS
ncbi:MULTISPECIES: hypothetical protein [Streptomyces]|uniref:hypothetical protein n=1 Tax=Streptomyces TaxID=1883 RepID=UPI00034E596B|nr:hypothetical protein [Streptomyces sp. GSL17-113]EPD95367.1 hypothetical protein HMPREF1486_02155 [Streptomyces sp. HPH0547]